MNLIKHFQKKEDMYLFTTIKKIPEKAISFKTLFRLGNTMKLFYTLYDNVKQKKS